ncbi:hypothetical protein [Alteribacillus sp. YIM 98480]|uniref:hypothetical protein n=1 Tax=Alteribacillus sp. YIM 98480 TaxID=2606599 RepID=UPI00131B8343|nr:hypothetical protein [Alteribacillus sp. YIM 98480]
MSVYGNDNKDVEPHEWKRGYFLLSDSPMMATIIDKEDFFSMEIYKADKKGKKPKKAWNKANRHYRFCHYYKMYTEQKGNTVEEYAVLQKTVAAPR